MPSTEEKLAEVKASLATLFSNVEGIAGASSYEPRRAPNMPWVSIITTGFVRRSLESNVVREPVVDPLGARRWIWEFTVRLWISSATDEKKAQQELDDLTARCVVALESDASLGSSVDDCTLSTGTAGVVNDPTGKPLFLMDCACQVEWTERKEEVDE